MERRPRGDARGRITARPRLGARNEPRRTDGGADPSGLGDARHEREHGDDRRGEQLSHWSNLPERAFWRLRARISILPRVQASSLLARRVAVLALLVTALPGCRKLIAALRGRASDDDDDKRYASDDSKAAATAAKPVPKTPAKLTVNWTKAELSIPELGVTGHADPYQLGYQILLERLPDGTKVKTGSKEEASQHGSFLTQWDMQEKIGALKPQDAFAYDYNFDPGDKMHLTFPDGATLDVPLPPASLSFGTKDALEKVKDGHGVTFGQEPDGAPKQHSIAYLDALEAEVFGPATKVTDIDWIAVDTTKPPEDQHHVCSGYTGGSTSDLPLWTTDATTVIYERKTGNVIDKKDFAASHECPMITSGDKAMAYVDSELPKAWLRERRLH